jgi:UDP-N-acetylmuramoyl-tripeptide--D-alanyl-D-alanine ligase
MSGASAQNGRATFKLIEWQQGSEDSTVTVRLAGEEHEARIGAPGRHIVQNALAVMGAAYLAGADMSKVMLRCRIRAAGRAGPAPPAGASQGNVHADRRKLQRQSGLHEGGIDLLDATPVAEGGRRIAVLGDMLELGSHSQRCTPSSPTADRGLEIDLVLLAGEEMRALAEAPPEREVRHFDSLGRSAGQHA